MELMVAMILSTIAMTLIFGTYMSYTKSVRGFSNRRDKTEAMTYSVNFIANELRKAKEIVSISPDSCFYISSHGDSTLFTFSDSTLFRSRTQIDSLKVFKKIDSLCFTLDVTSNTADYWRTLKIEGYTSRGGDDHPILYHRTILIPYREDTTSF